MSTPLTAEQQLRLSIFESRVKTIDRKALEELALEIYRGNIVQHNVYKRLLGEHWGILDKGNLQSIDE